MPLINGFEFMEFLNKKKINIPLIMMSADGSWPSIMKSIEVGACDYWVKPLSEQRLVNMWIDVVKNNIKDEEQKDIGSQKDDDRTRVVDDCDDDRTRVTDDSDDDDSDSADSVQWSTELNFLFHQALIKIGLEISKPEDILEAMNVPGLELEDVESHLE
ncbi:hypothetical protein PHAVU_005G022600, partial [Phaseolus vulgaris]